MNGVNIEELYFKQDGLTCHTGCDMINLLQQIFNESTIPLFCGRSTEYSGTRIEAISCGGGSSAEDQAKRE